MDDNCSSDIPEKKGELNGNGNNNERESNDDDKPGSSAELCESDESPSPRMDNDTEGSTKGSETENELDKIFKQAVAESTGENLSDQTLGGLCLYDCSILSTPTDKSMCHDVSLNNRTLNEGPSEYTFRGLHDLSCSMLEEGGHCLSKSKAAETINRIGVELQKKDEIIQMLCKTLEKASKEQKGETVRAKQLISQVSLMKEHFEDLTNYSQWSIEDRQGDENTSNSSANFRLSSYVRALTSRQEQSQQNASNECQLIENCSNGGVIDEPKCEKLEESRSSQTTPIPPESFHQIQAPDLDVVTKDVVQSLCISLLSETNSLRGEMESVRRLIRQPYENHEDFPIQKIVKVLNQINQCHENDMLTYQHQLAAEVKHRHEIQNNLKDEIRTLKMRFQEKIKQRDSEVAELRTRLLEENEDGAIDLSLNENLDVNRQSLDNSFNSNPDEETFSNLTRTKVEYLKLTPSEYVEDEVIDAVHIPDSYRQLLEDYNLKLLDMEKKFDSNRRYLEEQTHDREVERDEFQATLECLNNQIEELKKENAKLYEVNKQNVFQMEEYDARLKSAEEDEMDMIQKQEKTEGELKAAVEKIFELREIIRDLEKQIDSLSTSAIQLKEQNQVLLDELEKQEIINKKEQPVYNEQDMNGTLPLDITDEIQTQLHDLAKKIQFKIHEMDSGPLHTRPNSSCSGVASAISTEDISCRELVGRSSRNFENCPVEDIGSILLNEIRRLENQFENLIRIEDVVMKKLKDSELRCSGQKAKLEDIENQITIYQEKCTSQALKIADLEGKIDSLRFEAPNHCVVTSLKSRLVGASKQLEECKILLATRDQELSQIKLEYNTLKIKFAQTEAKPEQKESFSQTFIVCDGNSTFTGNFNYDGISPEKIRTDVDATNISITNNNIEKDGDLALFGWEYSQNKYVLGRSGSESSRGQGDGDNDERDDANTTVRQLDENLYELQKVLRDKDKMIKSLKKQLNEINNHSHQGPQHQRGHRDKCEEENVIIETELSLEERPKGPDGDPSIYEITHASKFEFDHGLLKYLGTRQIGDGIREESSPQHGRARQQETDLQVEIATLNTQIQQLKRALDDERKRSDSLSKQLKSCEEAKAALRSQSESPITTRSPIQNVASSQSITDYKMQQRELVHQIEDGRALLSIKHKEIVNLQDQIDTLEVRLNAKVEYEQELLTRLNSTSASLRRCEEHGRDLSNKNMESIKEIRRLRDQLDKVHSGSQNSENYPGAIVSGTGGDYLDLFMRAKSHKKALAWQKKYLASVVLGYKSILRQVGHGNEHPELLQIHIPLTPNAVGLYDKPSGKKHFRVGVLAVLAVIRMKYMVNRWHRKRNVDGSPDSEYHGSRQAVRVDPNILIRPSLKGILVNSRVQPTVLPFTTSSAPLINNNFRRSDSISRGGSGGNIGDISDYLNRFETLENEISSQLTRNTFPSINVNKN